MAPALNRELAGRKERADSELLRQVRRGLADPGAPTVRLPVMMLTRAEARFVERVLSRREPRG